MFLFSICEAVFMCSMAMSYFYSWQTYSVKIDSQSKKHLQQMSQSEREKHKPEVIPVGFREVLIETVDDLQATMIKVIESNSCQTLKRYLEPVLVHLE